MKILLSIYFIFFIFNSAKALEIKKEQLDILSNNKTWLKLIHNKNKKNEIITKNFYLSNKKTPQDELLKTLKAYKNFIDYKKDDSHPQCRFPARYYWLSKKLHLKNYNELEPFCTKLNKWEAVKKTTSISIILVSGYLGNPASTFGHSFIKLNSSDNSSNDLFDLSVNYGALVPDNEPIIKYIFKGIFGGYKAGFSDKYFYTQDLVYSHNEFRDMWNYKLNLNDYERKLILYHIWEVVAKKFDYYFLDKNCAYRVSEVLELISKKPIIDNAMLWYAPIETFHKLEEINKNNKLIKSVTYIPSAQKKIYKRFNLLNRKEKALVTNIIKSDYENITNSINRYDVNTKTKILNFLLEFEKYQLIKDSNREDKYKNTILMERFKLPITKEQKLEVKDKASPAKGNKPSILSLSTNYLSGFGAYGSLNYTAFAIESIGDNSLDFDELVVGETSIAYKYNKLFLNSFDLIKIKKLKTINLPWEDSFSPSWNLNIGSKAIYDKKKVNNLFIDGGVGKSFKLTDNTIFYTLVNSSINSTYPYVKVSPNINLNFELLNIKNYISSGMNLNPYNDDKNVFVKFESQYKLSQDISFALEYEKDEYEKSSINLKYFF